MKIEHLPIGKIKLNPDNPRQISNKDKGINNYGMVLVKKPGIKIERVK